MMIFEWKFDPEVQNFIQLDGVTNILGFMVWPTFPSTAFPNFANDFANQQRWGRDVNKQVFDPGSAGCVCVFFVSALLLWHRQRSIQIWGSDEAFTYVYVFVFVP